MTASSSLLAWRAVGLVAAMTLVLVLAAMVVTPPAGWENGTLESFRQPPRRALRHLAHTIASAAAAATAPDKIDNSNNNNNQQARREVTATTTTTTSSLPPLPPPSSPPPPPPLPCSPPPSPPASPSPTLLLTYVNASSKVVDMYTDDPVHICPDGPSVAVVDGTDVVLADLSVEERVGVEAGLEALAGLVEGKLRADECVFMTAACAATPAGMAYVEASVKGLEGDTERIKEWVETRLLPGGAGSLGRCAVVGNADSLSKQRPARGEQIDNHDTIFRYSVPMKGYDDFIGRKTSVVVVKPNYILRYGDKANMHADLAYVVADPPHYDENPPSEGTRFLAMGPGDSELYDAQQAVYGAMYRIKNPKKKKDKHAELITRKPSWGWETAMQVVASGLCTHVDLYGFSGLGGKKYFSDEKSVSGKHHMVMEHYAYQRLMARGQLCVYGE